MLVNYYFSRTKTNRPVRGPSLNESRPRLCPENENYAGYCRTKTAGATAASAAVAVVVVVVVMVVLVAVSK